jgi:hypothetical protein
MMTIIRQAEAAVIATVAAKTLFSPQLILTFPGWLSSCYPLPFLFLDHTNT